MHILSYQNTHSYVYTTTTKKTNKRIKSTILKGREREKHQVNKGHILEINCLGAPQKQRASLWTTSRQQTTTTRLFWRNILFAHSHATRWRPLSHTHTQSMRIQHIRTHKGQPHDDNVKCHELHLPHFYSNRMASNGVAASPHNRMCFFFTFSLYVICGLIKLFAVIILITINQDVFFF